MVAPLWICMFLLMRQLEEVGNTAKGSAGAKLLTYQSHRIKQLYFFQHTAAASSLNLFG